MESNHYKSAGLRFSEMENQFKMLAAEHYYDLQDQMDRAIQDGENFINTSLCDFDKIQLKKNKIKLTREARAIYLKLKEDGYVLAVCIEGQPFNKKEKLFYSNTFLHIRWEKNPFLFHLNNQIFRKDTWKKDIPEELISSDNRKETKWEYEESKWKDIIFDSSKLELEIPVSKKRKRTILKLKNKKVLIQNITKTIRSTKDFLIVKSHLKLIPRGFIIRKEKRDKLKLINSPLILKPLPFSARKKKRTSLLLYHTHLALEPISFSIRKKERDYLEIKRNISEKPKLIFEERRNLSKDIYVTGTYDYY